MEDCEEREVDIAVVQALINRRTVKALGDPAAPLPADGGLSPQMIGELVALAGNAPFHYPAHPEARGDGPKEPWRVHMMGAPACRALLSGLEPADNPGKIADMLACADALLCVTWLPDPHEGAQPEMSDRNIEHIAATSAFIQSLLTAATSAGVPNYWSSGGILRTRKYLDMLAAGPAERLLGAVFLFPSDLSGVTFKHGALRDERASPSDWARWLEA